MQLIQLKNNPLSNCLNVKHCYDTNMNKDTTMNFKNIIEYNMNLFLKIIFDYNMIYNIAYFNIRGFQINAQNALIIKDCINLRTMSSDSNFIFGDKLNYIPRQINTLLIKRKSRVKELKPVYANKIEISIFIFFF